MIKIFCNLFLIVCISCEVAMAESIPNYVSIACAEGGARGGPGYIVRQLRKESGVCQSFTSHLPWQSNIDCYLLKDKMPPSGVTRHNISVSEFVKVWKLVEISKLQARKEVESDCPLLDGSYYLLIVRWGSTADKAQTSHLIFHSGTDTYKITAPIISAMKQLSDEHP